MHVAFLIGSLQKGGSERVLVNLTDYFISQGDRVTMVTTYRREVEYPLNGKAHRILSDLTKEETTKYRIPNFIRRFQKLRNIWKQERPDVIVSFIGKNNMMAILTARGLHIPVVVSVRGDPHEEYYSRWMRIAARYLFCQADRVILQTRQAMAFFPERVQCKAVILKNPLNPAFLKPRYEGIREKTIVAVGRVDANKNHKMAIEAFAQIASAYPDYQLIIYGEGECRSDLQKMVRSLGLEKQIELPGSIDQVAEQIYKASVFLLTSHTEGVPNTLIEAMSMGLTVIATDCPCGGPAGLIQDGVNGFLIPVGDTGKLKDSLQKILNDLQMMEKIGREASKTSAIYQPEIVNESWRKCLVSCIRQ